MSVSADWLGLFSEDYYLKQAPEAAAVAGGAAEHFRSTGWRALLDPHPLFSTRWYLQQLETPDAAVDPLAHYLDRGAAAGLGPHPLFDPVRYAARAEGATLDPTPLHHFLRADVARCVSPHWMFDVDLYRMSNPDVVAASVNPLLHYLVYGEREDRRPSVFFDPPYYRAATGLAAGYGGGLAHFATIPAGQRLRSSPLVDLNWYSRQLAPGVWTGPDLLQHFAEVGSRGALSAHPLFDADYYLRTNPDVAASGSGAFWHYIAWGHREHRAPHPLFANDFYLRSNPRAALSALPALSDYVMHGASELSDPHPMFDARHYVSVYPDALQGGYSPLEDYVRHGPEQRRHPHPLFDNLHQAKIAERPMESGQDPLENYVGGRSNLPPPTFDGRSRSRSETSALPDASSSRGQGHTPPIDGPLISMLVPMFNSNVALLRLCFDSVRSQSYDRWEVIAVDDGSTDADVLAMAQAFAARDSRFQAHRLDSNVGISAATNDALSRARGEFVAMLDHDDVLMPDALCAGVAALQAGAYDAVYTDQSYIEADGRFDGHYYKPAWSPALLTGVMYVGHLLMVSRVIALEVGGFDPRFDKVQDYEFMLRLSERTSRIAHAPGLLYGWRRAPGSIARDSGEKGAIEPLQQAAVDAHFGRLGRPCRASAVEGLHHRMRITPTPRARRPAVDLIRVIGPGKVHRTDVAVGLPDAGFETVETCETNDVAGLNAALAIGTSPLVICWDERVEARDGWLDHLLQYIEQDDVAFCSPHLFNGDGVVRMAGLVADAAEGLTPAMTGLRFGQDGYAGSLACDREVSALTLGLLGFKRQVVTELGGPSQDYGGLFYALGDLSFRAAQTGRRNVAVAERLTAVADVYDVMGEHKVSDRLIFTDRHASALAGGDRYAAFRHDAAIQRAARFATGPEAVG